MNKYLKCIVNSLFFTCLLDSLSYANEGVVTSIQDELCSKISEEEYTGATEYQCLGVNGYNLLTLYDDNRMSLDVVSPDNVKYPLDLWNKITTSFSVLDSDIEWRVSNDKKTRKPVALIIKIRNASVEIKPESWWVIAKVSPGIVCITSVLDSVHGDIDSVRNLADASLSQPCLIQ